MLLHIATIENWHLNTAFAYCPMNDPCNAKGCQTRQGMAENVLCKSDPLRSIGHLLCRLAREGQAYPEEP
jgi:hypothetical protein